jgi:hypothetical protein
MVHSPQVVLFELCFEGLFSFFSGYFSYSGFSLSLVGYAFFFEFGPVGV